MGNGSLRRALRPVATLALAFVVLPVYGAGNAKSDANGGGRNYDLRTSLEAGAPSLASAQAAAVERLRASVPGLLATASPLTGATRTLSNATGFLTAPRSGDAEQVAVDFVVDHLDLLGLAVEDLDDYEVTDRVPSAQTGVTHLYLRQRHAGLPVYNGQLHVNVGADGRILSVNNLFVPNLADALNTTEPSIAPEAAVAALAKHLGGYDLAGKPTSEPQLMILPVRPGEARLVWNFNVDLGNAWYDVTVDAVDGRLWTRFDWVADATYRVYQRPVEAPTFVAPLPPADGRVDVVDPHDTTASPFGWHDTNGVAGADTTLTSGNNVNACIDRSPADNSCDAGSQPNGGGTLVFTPAIDLTQAPTSYQPAAVVNLYYWNNIIHDVAYLYGFDEVGGNFQENNYGNGGAGSDSVNADGQDGAGTNNANFATPADGSNPRMQMFLWNLGTPNRDGDLDAGIIAHEYGHGISNRLVGGPANVGCLGNQEQPGEGLSDWWSLFYTFEAANPSVRGIGTYALFQATNGAGIRTQRYDKDPEPNTNTWTYGSLPGSAIPHGVGEKWAQAFWYAQGRLEDAHGFNADVYDFTGTGSDAGNVRAMFYIVQGLKNSACSPGFVDVRDGIIQAATSAYGGEDVCLLWEAFTDYGLGFSASQGSNNSINDQTPAFDLPPSCSGGPGGDYCASPALAIPDNLPAGATSTISITDTGDLQDLDVQINANHTWVGDLIFTLEHVDTGTSVTFYDRPGFTGTGFGCSGDNIPGVFGDDEGADGSFESNCLNATPAFPADGHFTPNNPLSAFDGEDLAGDWTLTVSDNAAGDTGTLVEWCVVPEVAAPTFPDIAVDPSSIDELLEAGQQVDVLLDITNNGDADLDWQISEEPALGGNTVYTSRATFDADFPGLPLEDFETNSCAAIVGFPAPLSSTTSGGACYAIGDIEPGVELRDNPLNDDGGGSPSGLVFIPGGTLGALNDAVLANTFIDAFELAFDPPVSAVGLELGSFTSAAVMRVRFFSGATMVHEENLASVGPAGAFLGIHAPIGVDLVEIFANNGGTGNGAEGVYEVLFGGDPACVAPADVPWLELDSTSGTTLPAATSTVTVTLDATGLEGGSTHQANLCVESNDADTPVVVVPVTLNVDPMPFLDGFETGDTSRWSSAVQSRPVGLAGRLAAQSLAPN